MTNGRSIRLFLVDGTSTGLLTAEIMNWTGHVLTGPRSKLSELVQRPECARTGVYFLVGPDPDDDLLTRVYIGESDDIAQRLRQHNRTDEKGGKDFWERVCLVTSKDMNLTKAHAKYLESRLIALTQNAVGYVVANGTAHDYRALPESDLADMGYFLEQIRIVLPALGFHFLQSTEGPTAERGAESPQASPRFRMQLPQIGIEAAAQEIDGEFVVLEGSLARATWASERQGGYQALHALLETSGVLAPAVGDTRRFLSDYGFNSPSAAASVIAGRSANGRRKWTVQGSDETYGQWQERQVAIAAPPSDDDDADTLNPLD